MSHDSFLRGRLPCNAYRDGLENESRAVISTSASPEKKMGELFSVFSFKFKTVIPLAGSGKVALAQVAVRRPNQIF